MIAPKTVCFYYSKDKAKSKKEAAIYRERRKGRGGWKSPSEHPKDKTGLDASAKQTRAKLNKRSRDADLSKDNSAISKDNQTNVHPCEGPLSLKGHVADKLYQERAPRLCLVANPNWYKGRTYFLETEDTKPFWAILYILAFISQSLYILTRRVVPGTRTPGLLTCSILIFQTSERRTMHRRNQFELDLYYH
ncbi:hypothetical protein Tco_0654495 [Tanacetum coccineum]|uniref:Uncharacterized protein n=1 Tax=Tanacetum coccineum TaxID=301880 RepID=A0ABQ4X3C9_9ASTR